MTTEREAAIKANDATYDAAANAAYDAYADFIAANAAYDDAYDAYADFVAANAAYKAEMARINKEYPE